MATFFSRDSHEKQLARQARERFVGEISRSLGEMGNAVQEQLLRQLDQPSNLREMQDRRDAWTLYQQHRQTWINGTVAAWQRALLPPAATSARSRQDDEPSLELLGDEVQPVPRVRPRGRRHVQARGQQRARHEPSKPPE